MKIVTLKSLLVNWFCIINIMDVIMTLNLIEAT